MYEIGKVQYTEDHLASFVVWVSLQGASRTYIRSDSKSTLALIGTLSIMCIYSGSSTALREGHFASTGRLKAFMPVIIERAVGMPYDL